MCFAILGKLTTSRHKLTQGHPGEIRLVEPVFLGTLGEVSLHLSDLLLRRGFFVLYRIEARLALGPTQVFFAHVGNWRRRSVGCGGGGGGCVCRGGGGGVVVGSKKASYLFIIFQVNC